MTKKPAKRKSLFPSPKNVRFSHLISTLEKFANENDNLQFSLREAKGSHTVIKFTLGDYKWRYTVPRPHGGKNKVLPVYIRKINKMIWEIEDVIASLEDTSEDENNGDSP